MPDPKWLEEIKTMIAREEKMDAVFSTPGETPRPLVTALKLTIANIAELRTSLDDAVDVIKAEVKDCQSRGLDVSNCEECIRRYGNESCMMYDFLKTVEEANDA